MKMMAINNPQLLANVREKEDYVTKLNNHSYMEMKNKLGKLIM